MSKKDCRLCVYKEDKDGVRCLTPERQRDITVTDCCVPEAPLRKLQEKTLTAEEFIAVTNRYINDVKNKSIYWYRLKNSLK